MQKCTRRFPSWTLTYHYLKLQNMTTEQKKREYNVVYSRKCAKLISQLYSSPFRRYVRSGCHCRNIRNPYFLSTRYVLMSNAIEIAISYFSSRCCESRYVAYLMSRFRYFMSQVKTRMQLETGKAKHGLMGSFKNIIAEEGYAVTARRASLSL